MTDSTISALPSASALSGIEVFPADQNSVTSSVTATQLKTFVSNSATLVTPALGTPSSGILTNCTGTASGLNIGGNASTVTTNANLTGDVTSAGNVTVVSNAAVIGKTLSGYVSGSGTITSSDSILTAIEKLNGNMATPSGGTVTSISVATVNGFSGVSSGGATPAITLGTYLTGIIKGSGTGLVAAVSGTDFVIPSGSVATVTTPAQPTITSVGTLSALTVTAPIIGSVTNANLTGDITSSGNVTTLTNAPVIAKVLTSYAAASGTVVATDSILSAIQKVDGNNIALSSAVTGALVYKGQWNASTNSPTLISSVGSKGYLYKVSVAGTTLLDGNSQWNVGDSAIFDGTTWDKFDGISSEVVSVAGRVGTVTLSQADISGLTTTSTPTFSTVTATTFNGALSGNATNITGTLATSQGGTGATASTGAGSNVLSTSPTLVTPILGTPTSGTLTNCTFPTLNQNTTGSAVSAATATLGDESTNIANTQFVYNAQHGQATIVLVNGVNTLTAAQWGGQGLILTGALTSVATVVVPNQAYQWYVIDNTTGGYQVTMQAGNGAGGTLNLIHAKPIYIAAVGTSNGIFNLTTPIDSVPSDGLTGILISNSGTGYITAVPMIPEYGEGAGTGDIITATFIMPNGIIDGITIGIDPVAANLTSTPTLNVNGTGAVTIVKGNGQPLAPYDIPGANAQLLLSYNSYNAITGLPAWTLVNPAVPPSPVYAVVSTATSVLDGTYTLVDTRVAAVSITLPVTGTVRLIDYMNTFNTHALTLIPTTGLIINGHTVSAGTGYYTVTAAGAAVTCTYVDTTVGYRIY